MFENLKKSSLQQVIFYSRTGPSSFSTCQVYVDLKTVLSFPLRSNCDLAIGLHFSMSVLVGSNEAVSRSVQMFWVKLSPDYSSGFRNMYQYIQENINYILSCWQNAIYCLKNKYGTITTSIFSITLFNQLFRTKSSFQFGPK